MEFDLLLSEIGRVLFAIFLGGLIGLERELASKPAGLRTHMLVSGAATLLVILGDIMVREYTGLVFSNVIQADPIRIIEAIITGISFLGAGTIIFKSGKESVEGLTTAASILFAAAIGITVALKQVYLASVITALVIFILFALGYIEKWIKSLREKLTYRNDEKKQERSNTTG